MYQAYVEKLREYEQWLERQQRRLDQAVQQSLQQQQQRQQQQQEQQRKNGSEKVLGVFSTCGVTCAQFEFVSRRRVCHSCAVLGSKDRNPQNVAKDDLLFYLFINGTFKLFVAVVFCFFVCLWVVVVVVVCAWVCVCVCACVCVRACV